ncbi:MAG: SEC-C metal-binding domain-containing protein [Desulfobacteraceae bacterium]|nr:SEC-C metal-binding domain-containing protein [Desulfobacteraceae bacterium]
MVKIGRNEQCPCGSGKKYKKCCLPQQQDRQNAILQPRPITVVSEIASLQAAAMNRQEIFKSIGVFIFFSTREGDAWLLELSDMDAVQVAKAGERIEVEINESPETIEVNWPYQFMIKDKVFITTAYLDKAVKDYPGYPTAAISAAIRKLQGRFSSDLLDQIHVDEQAAA